MATLSDATGQFVASCFDDLVSNELEEAGRTGACALLTVELDRKPGEELPRVTLKRVQPFEALAAHTRLKAELHLSDAAALDGLAALVSGSRGGRGELQVVLPTSTGTARLRLGRDFALDAELAARMEALPGVVSVTLGAAETPRLALVS